MTTQELATSDVLASRMAYARALAEASLLPPEYRKAPANVLLALEFAAGLGLSPMAAITGLHIIDGRPAASSALIGALVRRAGHRLRVEVAPDGTSARATIVRNDDPGFVFTSVWSMERAQAAGLAGRGTWKTHPVSMLKARAISEVARDACPEVISGVQAPDDVPDDVEVDRPVHVLTDRQALAVDTSTGELIDLDVVVDAEMVES